MNETLKRAESLHEKIMAACKKLDLDGLITQRAALTAELAAPDAWSDSEAAQQKAQRLSSITQRTQPWVDLRQKVAELQEMLKLGDDTLQVELDTQLDEAEADYAELEHDLLYDGPFDDHDVILRLSAGAGGTDAQDWAQMLERMYLRWAEKSAYKTEIFERSAGEEAGVKTVVIGVSGAFAYGKLRGEHGVHRLVRLSPFNADNLRQTSFALVEVLPQIDQPDEVHIDEKDLKIDVYRAGGHGGQSVNTTDSAVRVTHLPTGIVVSIQNERSQLQNKETAMKVLRSKLAQMQLEQRAQSLNELQAGESANWGSQIRNYVLHPYTLVKDTRTKHEERDAEGVLNGRLEGFIKAFLAHSQN